MAFFLSNVLQAGIVRQFEGECGKPEYIMPEIFSVNCFRLLLAVVYRPPHCGYLADFFNVFLDASISYKHSIILGDFNADLGSITYDSKQILSFVESSNLFLVPYSSYAGFFFDLRFGYN